MKLNLQLISGLRLWQKFAILGVLALVLVAVPTYQFVTASRVNIDFTNTERTGIEPSKALIELIGQVQTHRSLSIAALSGNENARTQLAAQQARVESAIKAAGRLVDAVPDEAAHAAWQRFNEQWRTLVKRIETRAANARETDLEQRKLVAEAFTVVDLIADHTLLTLDPDVDTYYLQRMALYEIGQLAETLSWLREDGFAYLTTAAEVRSGARRADAANLGDRSELHESDRRARERIDTILDAATKVYAATPATQSRLEAPLRSAIDAAQKALQVTLSELLEREAPNFPAAQYAQAHDAAIAQLLKADLAALAEFDNGLAARAAKLRSHELQVLGIISLLTVLIAVVSLAIVRSLTRPVGRLVGAMEKVRSGDVTARARLSSGDEIGLMAQQFDTMMDEREALLKSTREKEYDQLNDSVLQLLQAVARLSQRDLTVKVPVSEDVTGAVSDALNLLAAETAQVLSQVKQVAEDVADASTQVRSQSDSVVAMARVERDEVQESSRELNEAARTMKDIANLARDCNDAAQRAIGTTRTALDSVGATVGSIGTIRDTVRETEKRIKRLGERSQEISNVVNLINTISERTHILALNAAMHAASAGEAGRGFAVVAGEVQRLAENAREATSQIASLVHNIQVETADTVNKMNEVITQVVDGSRLAEQAGQQMRDTEQSTGTLVQMVAQIAGSAQSQAQTSEALRSRAEKIEKSTQLTGDELREQAAQTERLVDFAQTLVRTVGVFKLPEGLESEAGAARHKDRRAA